MIAPLRKQLYHLNFLYSAVLCDNYDYEEAAEDVHDFDFLLFTQRWPETTCYEWMKKNHEHTCRLPSTGGSWTVHGIWPTRNGSKEGPFYCNKTMHFDIHQISDLVPKLEEHWTNVEKETPEAGLWKHEWEKHGTCASVLQPFHSENYYFGQGLSWYQTYAMGPLLQGAGIKPDHPVYAGQMHNSIYSVLKTNPVIECYHEKGTQYITEIRICFDKDLKLRDCDGAVSVMTGVEYKSYHSKQKGTMITNCDPMKLIEYPSVVPQVRRPNQEGKFGSGSSFPYVKFYRIITFLRWLSF